MRELLDLINELSDEGSIELHDSFDIELSEDFVIETGVVALTEDGIVVEGDDKLVELLETHGLVLEKMVMGLPGDQGSKVMGEGSADEPEPEDMDADDKRWDDKEECPVCHKHPCECDELDEAEYHGRKVPLGKPMKGDVKKSKVYVRKPNGKVVKVNFGDKKMRIKKSNPKRRKSFRARHNCANPGPRWKARYWSCRAW